MRSNASGSDRATEPTGGDARVGDHDVDAAEALDRALHGLLQRGRCRSRPPRTTSAREPSPALLCSSSSGSRPYERDLGALRVRAARAASAPIPRAGPVIRTTLPETS